MRDEARLARADGVGEAVEREDCRLSQSAQCPPIRSQKERTGWNWRDWKVRREHRAAVQLDVVVRDRDRRQRDLGGGGATVDGEVPPTLYSAQDALNEADNEAALVRVRPGSPLLLERADAELPRARRAADRGRRQVVERLTY